ncbi:MAG: hypothetical protein AAF298_25290, partial [Cyanobacteria bacterium P01_A01_bin.40]
LLPKQARYQAALHPVGVQPPNTIAQFELISEIQIPKIFSSHFLLKKEGELVLPISGDIEC